MASETGISSSKQSLLSLAALLVAAGFALPPAQAADLGGNCCADLEERVAELEATTARKGNRRVSLTISGAVHTQVMAWDAGNAGAVRSGTGKFSFKKDKQEPFSYAGSSSDVYITDYTAGTGFNFTGSAQINPSLSAGFLINVGLDTGARSLHVNQNDDDADEYADASIVISRAAWYLDHKQIGRLTVGRQNTASHGITTIDLGGAGVIASPDVSYWNGSFVLADGVTTWTTALGGGTVAGAGSTRGNLIHYTSPTFGGFSVQGAWGEDDVWDVALRYAGEFSGIRLAAGVGYIDNFNSNNHGEDVADHEDGDGKSAWKAGASVMHVASGLYLTGAYVDQDNGDAAPGSTSLTYVQGGIAKNWTGLGNTVLYGEYTWVDGARSGAFDGGSADSQVWGLGVVQHIDAASMEVYLAFRQYSTDAVVTHLGIFDDPWEINSVDVGTDDFNILMTGARIRF